jgi:hypothetical protein
MDTDKNPDLTSVFIRVANPPGGLAIVESFLATDEHG